MGITTTQRASVSTGDAVGERTRGDDAFDRWTPQIDDRGAGYDLFGAHPAWIQRLLRFNAFFYDTWFRVESHGVHNIPASGSAIVVANHSGNYPFDGAMIWADVLRKTTPSRLLRPIAAHFMPTTPFLATLVARMGVVGGVRANVDHLLSTGELLLIFPEGIKGITKGFRERYRLRDFTPGHAEFAIRHQVPIIPLAVIGAEEQLPEIFGIPYGKFGVKRIPVPVVPFPLPVRYRLHYGEPIDVSASYAADVADDPEAVQDCARRVRATVQALVDEGLQQREGVFR